MKEEDNDLNIKMTWSCECDVEDSGEPDYLIYGTEGELFNMGDDDNNRELAGRFSLFYVDAERAINERASLFEALDCHSQTMLDYYQLFEENGEYGFSDRVMKIVPEGTVVNYNLLVVDRIEILPKFRGKKLGLRVLRQIMNRFACGTDIVALKPFPLQFEGMSPGIEAATKWREEMGLAQMTKHKRVATKKLRDYYASAGFRLVRGTQMMIRSMG